MILQSVSCCAMIALSMRPGYDVVLAQRATAEAVRRQRLTAPGAAGDKGAGGRGVHATMGLWTPALPAQYTQAGTRVAGGRRPGQRGKCAAGSRSVSHTATTVDRGRKRGTYSTRVKVALPLEPVGFAPRREGASEFRSWATAVLRPCHSLFSCNVNFFRGGDV